MFGNLSAKLRRSVVRTLAASRRGHLAPALSLIEILGVLYDDVLRVDPDNPLWPDRDRCILSKGHGCLALYAVLEEKGFITKDDLDGFCRHGSMLGGHPELHKVPGVEATTGSLGHGLPLGLGYALAARLDGRPSRVFVIMGDGECNEGSVWEAALSASKHRADNLVVIVDYNKQQSYGSTSEVVELEPFADKWRAFGFSVAEVPGHDHDALRTVFSSLPLESGKPTALICHTIKGKGIDFVEANLSWHHKSSLTDQDLERLRLAVENE
ncbi:MAG: transketolase [Desulfovibrio sp.]|nr:transketolase [Desulfovibrio sp.]MBI4957959.1 transketolase [Desulfovibrio sp.]